MSDYITNCDTIIFASKFNKLLDFELINKYKNLIFSNYILDDNLFDKYKNDNIYNLQFIGSEFNQKVNNLPNSIIHLTFGQTFNQEVNNLPNSLTYLTFGWHFNQKVDLPFSVKYLKLNCNNQYLIDNLSNNIEELELDYNFNLELNNLPSSIKKILFYKNSEYNKELNCLPNFVETIKLPINYNKKISKIPSGLKKLICHISYKYINDYNDINIEKYDFNY